MEQRFYLQVESTKHPVLYHSDIFDCCCPFYLYLVLCLLSLLISWQTRAMFLRHSNLLSLSLFEQRLYGFVICLVTGLTCTLMVSSKSILHNFFISVDSFLFLRILFVSCNLHALFVAVNAGFLQSNQVWYHVHLWKFAFTWEVCAITSCTLWFLVIGWIHYTLKVIWLWADV